MQLFEQYEIQTYSVLAKKPASTLQVLKYSIDYQCSNDLLQKKI